MARAARDRLAAAFHESFGEQDPAPWREHAAGFGQAGGAVGPVVDGAERPGHSGA